MRAKSPKTNGYLIYAVSGTNSVSFAIDFREANTKGLLGFAVERIDHRTGERKYMDGFKVFKNGNQAPGFQEVVSTYTQPVQSFVWDDFGCHDDTQYDYLFHPLKGTPKDLDRSAKAIPISVRTEKAFTNGSHDVFFNRGVASSQAYARKYFNLPPDKITDPVMQRDALNWLSRQLDDALFAFIANAKPGESLYCCFYEFRYAPVLEALKQAGDNGVTVRVIVDLKKNESTDSRGVFHESFPKEENLKAITKAKLKLTGPDKQIIRREAKPDSIQHNKFMVRVDKNGVPREVWTGSTNISLGGIHGQTNVGHWIRNKDTAVQYKKYWDILSADPGGRDGEDRATVRTKNDALKTSVEALKQNFDFQSWDEIPVGITPVFSPRSGGSMLDAYARMFDSAEDLSCITLAFGINDLFKDYLEDNTTGDHLSFFLLEKEDKPAKNSTKAFRNINASQNVYKAFGAYIEDDLYRWAEETSTMRMGLNTHVMYIHSKFMIVDPLGDDPVVVTGSANFSKDSMNDNDENMVIIRGDQRVADIYFTEFNRLFNHYYFRSIRKSLKENKGKTKKDEGSLFLEPDDSWLAKYKSGQLRRKRVEVFTRMKGITSV